LIAGRYRVERKLGAGGMGIVVAAIDLQTSARVAIKLLLPEGPMPSAAFRSVDDSGVIERSNRHIEMSTRLIREASAAARLSSEHVTRVLDVGRMESGDPYVVMEMLEGVDLGQYAKERGPLPVVETINLVLQACEAIFEAHERGIVHRDLKPANLFLTSRPDGSAFVKVLDFGISKVLGSEDDNQLTATSDMLGSPLYMAPEQIRNARDVDTRADVWSIGTILYRLLAGRAAFEGPGSAATLAAIIGDMPYPLRAIRPDVPQDLEVIVLRCLEKDRNRRIQTVRELAIALHRFAVAQTGTLRAAVQVPGGPSPYEASGPQPAAVAAGPPGAFTPAGSFLFPPPPALPASLSEGPSSITVSGTSGRSSAFFAGIGLFIGALLAGGLVAWQLGSGGLASSSSAAPAATGAATVALAASTTAEPSVPEVPTAALAPSASATTSASATASASATVSATAAPSSSASVRPAPHPIGHGRPTDDPLGDRL
jgi:serine/threonine-protein kinase